MAPFADSRPRNILVSIHNNTVSETSEYPKCPVFKSFPHTWRYCEAETSVFIAKCRSFREAKPHFLEAKKVSGSLLCFATTQLYTYLQLIPKQVLWSVAGDDSNRYAADSTAREGWGVDREREGVGAVTETAVAFVARTERTTLAVL